MSEDRLVTLILWVVLVIGTAFLGAVYFATSGHLGVEPPVSTISQRETESSDTLAERLSPPPVTTSDKAAEPSVDQLKKEPATTLASATTQAPIYETAKANGSFQRAQEISEGLIIGRRGSVDDRADYYKVRASGHAMVLRIESSAKERDYGFTLTVFDSHQQSIGEDLEEADSPITLSVRPQAIYYIKLAVGNVPIETPQYQLHVHFD